ncbi:voltage-dependent calcium channel subunit alpha-2/delta-4 like protein [Danaus plexippus plexippus]|uniref:Voltage-dependent calcium channel subunit alpha-2/delta-4 like protein n=1 Tax=Danaus plexippus plexippus TaxID=278856 RepID=A0A212ELL5_DANPL|nr:voltage-dependent calcium channel subunit alpha-2/delta-4 like protein [Danaus plexippus plexippus]
MNQIQNKYHEYNVEVVRKDGLLLVRELAVEVKNHMDFKMNAVMDAMIPPPNLARLPLSKQCFI